MEALQLFVRLPGGRLRACQVQPDDSLTSLPGLEAAAGPGSAGLRVVCGGRTLEPGAALGRLGLSAGATLELLPRLCGGGGDGGSTGAESRSSYLEMYAGKKPDKVNPEEERLARWNSCQLSGMPLQPPCVVDELGSLFNKDAIIQALLTKSMPRPLAHITSLKHLIELKLGDSAGPAGAAAAGGKDDSATRFACPITGQAFNGKYRFVVLRKTGHVLSERALKEVPKVVEELVGGKWEAADLLPINPCGDELQSMREALLLKRTAERAAKKEKKSAKAAAIGGSGGEAAAANGGKRHAEASNGGGGGAAAANGGSDAAQGAAKRYKAAELAALKPKGADDKVWASLFTSSGGGGEGGKKSNTDYMCRAATRYVS